MYESGENAWIAAEMRNYSLTILKQDGLTLEKRGWHQVSCCFSQDTRRKMRYTLRAWPWCYQRQPKEHSLDGRRIGPRFLVANFRANKLRSNYMSSSAMHQLMKVKRKKKMNSMTALVEARPRKNSWGISMPRLGATAQDMKISWGIKRYVN